jgi:hypothetical protein
MKILKQKPLPDARLCGLERFSGKTSGMSARKPVNMIYGMISLIQFLSKSVGCEKIGLMISVEIKR